MNDPKKRSGLSLVGVGVAIGAGVGAAFFAVAQNPVWIGVGAGIGVAIGAALQARRS